MFTVGQKVWTPDSLKFGQGVITEVGVDGDVKVAHIDIHGKTHEIWFDSQVVQLAPTANQLEVQASNTFRARHRADFNPCAANVKLMTECIRGHGWSWTADSLERAFSELTANGRLALMPAPVQPASKPAAPVTREVANPASVTPVTPTAPAAPRLTKKEIASWSWQTMLEKMKDPEIAKQMEGLGIPVLHGSMSEIQSRNRRKH